MKISKRTREQAALICAVTASRWSWGGDSWATTHNTAERLGLRVNGAAQNLANKAWDDAQGRCTTYGSDVAVACVYAEAEALLRTGWSP